MTTQEEKNIRTALSLLDDEINGDVKSALSKMHPEYSMTWVYKSTNGKLFPRQYASKSDDLRDVYLIKGRGYDIKHVTSREDVVMIEMIENYPDQDTKKIHRTPQVIVLEFRDGKVLRGRHYCDPQISYLDLDDNMLTDAYK